MNKAVIVGATSGIGSEVAKLLLDDGWTIGIAGRREDRLEELRRLAPDRVFVQTIDICRDDAPDRLQQLISAMGGIDLYFHASGVGKQNPNLDIEIELDTLYTNGLGFVRMIDMAYKYFEQNNDRGGHIAIISSIAGTKGIGVAPSYSKYIFGVACAVGSHQTLEYQIYGYTSWVCRYRPAQRPEALSYANEATKRSPTYRASYKEKKAYRHNRLEISVGCSRVAYLPAVLVGAAEY